MISKLLSFGFSLLLLCLIKASNESNPGKKPISVLEFGAIPDDNRNDITAMRKAAEYCRSNPNTVLAIPPGVYDVVDPLALEIEKNAIIGVYGGNPQDKLFKPGAPYVKVLDFTGAKNLTVNGAGATLLMSGWYEPVSIINTTNFELNGLAIDYKRPPNTTGTISKLGSGYFDVEVDSAVYTLLEKKVIGSLHFYHPPQDHLYGINVSGVEMISKSLMRMQSNERPRLGDIAVIRHSGHYRPAVMILNSKHVTLKNLKIHAQPGMGIVGHLSEGILIDQLQVIPLPGRYISTNTDATHFTSCKGMIVISNSKFGGQGDDCTNIHNYYYEVEKEPKAGRYTINIRGADLHAQALDYPDKGDRMLLVSRKSLKPIQEYKVQRVDTSAKNWKVSIELDRTIDFDMDTCFMTNYTRIPSVRLINNTVRGHLARAFLIKAKNVLISGNTIQNSTGTAIQLGPEAGWRESGPVSNVVIEDNWIISCGSGRGTQNDASAISVGVSGTDSPFYLNQNIIIRNNVIYGLNKHAIYLGNAQYVTVVGNSISGTENAVVLQNVKDANIQHNGKLPIIRR